MTKTENYQLNQWEPTDKISRADFNEDNVKIDAALAAATPPEYISVSTSGKVDGDTIYTFSKAPRFVLLQGIYGTDLIYAGKTITMLDYHSYNYKYLVTLKLSEASLIMTNRDETSTIGTLRMIAFY